MPTATHYQFIAIGHAPSVPLTQDALNDHIDQLVGTDTSNWATAHETFYGTRIQPCDADGNAVGRPFLYDMSLPLTSLFRSDSIAKNPWLQAFDRLNRRTHPSN